MEQCGGVAVPKSRLSQKKTRDLSESDVEATNVKAPEAKAPEATPETSSEEPAVEPSGEAEATSDDASNASSDGGSQDEESDAMADSDDEHEGQVAGHAAWRRRTLSRPPEMARSCQRRTGPFVRAVVGAGGWLRIMSVSSRERCRP